MFDKNIWRWSRPTARSSLCFRLRLEDIMSRQTAVVGEEVEALFQEFWRSPIYPSS